MSSSCVYLGPFFKRRGWAWTVEHKQKLLNKNITIVQLIGCIFYNSCCAGGGGCESVTGGVGGGAVGSYGA